jgi:hypothetical protein
MANCECHNQVGYIFYIELMVFSTTKHGVLLAARKLKKYS